VHENAYDDTVDFIQTPPADAQILEIAPPDKLESQIIRWEHSFYPVNRHNSLDSQQVIAMRLIS